MAASAAVESGATGTGGRFVAMLAWTGLGLALVCAVGTLAAGLGYRAGWWAYSVGTQMVRWFASADLAALVLALLALVLALRSANRRMCMVAGAGLLLGFLVGGMPLTLWLKVGEVPRIHGISTDTLNPPRFVAILPLRQGVPNSTNYTPEVAALQKKGYPDIGPVSLAMAPPQALKAAEQVARSIGWEIVAVDPLELRLEATATSLLFGFKDDVVIRVAAEGAGSRVDMRSLSRVGRSDFGVNAKRVRAFSSALAAVKAGG